MGFEAVLLTSGHLYCEIRKLSDMFCYRYVGVVKVGKKFCNFKKRRS